MMGPANNPSDSFLNSIRVINNPTEPNLREAVRNFKDCFNGFVKHVNISGTANCFVVEQAAANLNVKKTGQNVGIGKKAEFPIEVFFGMYTENCSTIDHYKFNFIHGDAEKVSNKNSSCYDGGIKSKVKAGKNDWSFECLKLFIFDKLRQFPVFDEGVQDYDEGQFDNFKAFCNVLGGKRGSVNGFLTNLKFARIGVLSKKLENNRIGNVWGTNGGKEASRSLQCEAAAVPPVDSVLRSALAGGLSCASSAAIMHPVDTVKTWVQSSTLTFPEVLSKLPQFGIRALYRGSIPAILGQFSSHWIRTGICEASKLVLVTVAPTLPEMQVEAVASFCGTFLGTAMRIPCEVLKQRLQAGLFENVGQAVKGTWQQDGLAGFFRGTGATLCREIPFYVAGMGLYAKSKKAVQRIIGRELQPWETVAVGALSGGLTAVLTTPIDVIKTKMMVATHGQPATLSVIVLSILRHEGPVGLFKGAVPRFFWVAPLGAMNFAGYELLRKAMD